MRQHVRKLTSPSATPEDGSRRRAPSIDPPPFLLGESLPEVDLDLEKSDDTANDYLTVAETPGHIVRPRTVGTVQLAIWVYLCVNGGPYGIEEVVSATTPLILICFIAAIPWLWCLPVALMTAELSTLFDNDCGGMITWARHAFGKRTSFAAAILYWLSNATDNAMYAILIPEYVDNMFGLELSPYAKAACGLAVIALVVLINASGLEFSGIAAAVLSFVTLAPIVLLLGMAVPKVESKVWSNNEGETDWAIVFALVLWMFSGFDDVGSMADAIKNPQKTYPRAMILAVLVIILNMEATVMITLCVDQRWAEWDDGYLAEIARQVGGNALRLTVGFGALFGLFSNLLAQLLATAQALHHMSISNWLPKFVSMQREKDGTQVAAIISAGVISCCFQLVPFKVMAEVHTVFYSLVVFLEMSSFLALRHHSWSLARPYKALQRQHMGWLLAMGPFAVVGANIYSANPLTKYIAGGVVLVLACVCGLHYLCTRLKDEESVDKVLTINTTTPGGHVTTFSSSNSDLRTSLLPHNGAQYQSMKDNSKSGAVAAAA